MARRKGKANTTAEDFARESVQMFKQEYDPACAECGMPLTLCGGHVASSPPTTRPPGWLAPMPAPPIFVTLTDEEVDRIARRLWHLIRGVEPPP